MDFMKSPLICGLSLAESHLLSRKMSRWLMSSGHESDHDGLMSSTRAHRDPALATTYDRVFAAHPSFDFAESHETAEPFMTKTSDVLCILRDLQSREFTTPGETRVDTDASGRRVLTNEMRALGR